MHGNCGLFFTSYAGEEQLFPSRFQKICLLLFLALLLCAPRFLNLYLVSILNLVMIAVIGAVSLNLLTGCCGQISLGHGAFIGVGAYGCAIAANLGAPFYVALPVGGLLAAGVGMVFGIPSLRLKGIYLAISTLAAQMILEYVFLHWEKVTGGSGGMAVPSPELFGFAFDNDTSMFYLILAVALVSCLMVANLIRSRHGRAFVAVRDFHQSAENVGIHLFVAKLQAFAVSSFLAGVAGGLWGYYALYITPEQFGIGLSISYLAMIIIGGLGGVQGAVMGAAFITLLPEILGTGASLFAGAYPELSLHILALKEGIFGLVLVLFLIFEPEGLAHRWRLVKAYWKLYPFAH